METEINQEVAKQFRPTTVSEAYDIFFIVELSEKLGEELTEKTLSIGLKEPSRAYEESRVFGFGFSTVSIGVFISSFADLKKYWIGFSHDLSRGNHGTAVLEILPIFLLYVIFFVFLLMGIMLITSSFEQKREYDEKLKKYPSKALLFSRNWKQYWVYWRINGLTCPDPGMSKLSADNIFEDLDKKSGFQKSAS